jgi:hypothetical protein
VHGLPRPRVEHRAAMRNGSPGNSGRISAGAMQPFIRPDGPSSRLGPVASRTGFPGACNQGSLWSNPMRSPNAEALRAQR